MKLMGKAALADLEAGIEFPNYVICACLSPNVILLQTFK